nr:hypothetical protein [Tanacetum cinerariifolium]
NCSHTSVLPKDIWVSILTHHLPQIFQNYSSSICFSSSTHFTIELPGVLFSVFFYNSSWSRRKKPVDLDYVKAGSFLIAYYPG